MESNMIAIDESTIESLTLYDEAETEIGSADKITDDRWHCEFRWAGNVHTSETANVYAAWEWLNAKRKSIGIAGVITAIADFQIDLSNTGEPSAIVTLQGINDVSNNLPIDYTA